MLSIFKSVSKNHVQYIFTFYREDECLVDFSKLFPPFFMRWRFVGCARYRMNMENIFIITLVFILILIMPLFCCQLYMPCHANICVRLALQASHCWKVCQQINSFNYICVCFYIFVYVFILYYSLYINIYVLFQFQRKGSATCLK